MSVIPKIIPTNDERLPYDPTNTTGQFLRERPKETLDMLKALVLSAIEPSHGDTQDEFDWDLPVEFSMDSNSEVSAMVPWPHDVNFHKFYEVMNVESARYLCEGCHLCVAHVSGYLTGYIFHIGILAKEEIHTNTHRYGQQWEETDVPNQE